MSDDKQDIDEAESGKKTRNIQLLKNILTRLFQNDSDHPITFPDDGSANSGQETKIEGFYLDPLSFKNKQITYLLRNKSLSNENMQILSNYFVQAIMQPQFRDEISAQIGRVFEEYSQKNAHNPFYSSIEDQFCSAQTSWIQIHFDPTVRHISDAIAKTIHNELSGSELRINRAANVSAKILCLSALTCILFLIAAIIFIIFGMIASYGDSDYSEEAIGTLKYGMLPTAAIGLCLFLVGLIVQRIVVCASENLAQDGRTTTPLPKMLWEADLPDEILHSLTPKPLDDADLHHYFTAQNIRNMIDIDGLAKVFSQHGSPDIMSILIDFSYPPAISSYLIGQLNLGASAKDSSNLSITLPPKDSAAGVRFEAKEDANNPDHISIDIEAAGDLKVEEEDPYKVSDTGQGIEMQTRKKGKGKGKSELDKPLLDND